MTSPYGEEFFAGLEQESRASADVVLEVLLEGGSIASVLDVGCGRGAWLAAARALGVREVVGVDGPWAAAGRLAIPDSAFVAHDLTRPLDVGRTFGLVLGLEVAEHLPPSAAEVYVDSLARHGDLVLFSAAIPGQGGTAHVNEQWPSYWIERFARRDFEVFDLLRARLWVDRRVAPWYRQNLLLFARGGALDAVAPAAAAGGGSPGAADLVHPEIYEHVLHWSRADWEGTLTLRGLGRRIPRAALGALTYRLGRRQPS